MAILEGAWDCSDCSQQRIHGRNKTCTNCGAPRDVQATPDEAPYLPADTEVVTDPELLELAEAGADWKCDHCGHAANRGDSDRCDNCGQGHDEPDVSNPVVTYGDGVFADRLGARPLSEVPRAPKTRSEPNKRYGSQLAVEDTPPPVTPLTAWQEHWPKLAGAAAVLLVVLGGITLYNKFKTSAVELTVTSLVWERSVGVEEYRTLREEDWSVPDGGREIRNFQAVKSHEKVFSHYDSVPHTVTEQEYAGSKTETYACGTKTVDKGNGFFSTETEYCTRTVPQYQTKTRTEYRQVPVYNDVPVYDTKYEYDIERWIQHRWVTASEEAGGELGIKPYWPEVLDLGAKERVGLGRQEKYTVGIAFEYTYGKTSHWVVDLGYEQWSKLELDQVLIGYTRQDGTIVYIDWPQ